MFDIVSDIESFPLFLPGWVAARIERDEDDHHHLFVEQVVGFGALRLTFKSEARLERPVQVLVRSYDRLFRHYELCWRITSADTGCRISVTADIQLASGLMQFALDRFLDGAADDILRAFEARARALYGSGGAGRG